MTGFADVDPHEAAITRAEIKEQEARAEELLRAHYEDTDWDGDVDAVKRLNPGLWNLYLVAALEGRE